MRGHSRLKHMRNISTSHGTRCDDADVATVHLDDQVLPPEDWKSCKCQACTSLMQPLSTRSLVQVHYIPIVYEELNNVLLNMLCDADAQFVEQVPG